MVTEILSSYYPANLLKLQVESWGLFILRHTLTFHHRQQNQAILTSLPESVPHRAFFLKFPISGLATNLRHKDNSKNRQVIELIAIKKKILICGSILLS